MEPVLSTKLGIRNVRESSLLELLSSVIAVIHKAAGEKGVSEFDFFTNLSEAEQKFLKEKAKSLVDRVNEDFVVNLQKIAQKVLKQDYRKRIAAYYTKDVGRRLMAKVAKQYAEEVGNVVLADPFLGTGLTLTAAITEIGYENIKEVWGIELDPLAGLIANAALLYFMNGDSTRVRVEVGDAFSLVSKSRLFGIKYRANVILTNPPFARWESLDRNIKETVTRFIQTAGYNKYVTRRQFNLQVACTFLLDFVLESNGLLASVLPASTFYTITGEGVKLLLKKGYDVLAMVESKKEVSFSDGSGFKENIIIALKDKKPNRTLFITLDDNVELDCLAKSILRKQDWRKCKEALICEHELTHIQPIQDMNWLTLFANTTSSIIRSVLESQLVSTGREVIGDKIVRGVEMYGPDFFLLPNRFWSIMREKDDEIEIRNNQTNEYLYIRKEFLVKTLRRPSLYGQKIQANPQHYFLSLPPKQLDSFPKDVREYVKWGTSSHVAEPAIRMFGKFWYSHVHKQLGTKRPFGQVFIPDKVDRLFNLRGVFANYTAEPVTATKDFYIIKNVSDEVARFITAWFNSTVFLSLLIVGGRRISETWTRFLEEDYLRLPFPSLPHMTINKIRRVNEALNKIIDKDLPAINKQMEDLPNWRRSLDVAILKALEIDNEDQILEKLAASLKSILS
jgi:hypothetical protein